MPGMIRIALTYLAIVVVLCAVIIVDPMGWLGGKDTAADQTAALSVPASSVAAAVAAQEAAAAAEPRTAVALAAAVAAGSAPQAPAAPSGLIVDNSDLARTTEAILADLRGEPSPTAPAAPDALQAMSASALADLQALRRSSQQDGQVSLQSLVVQALREGQSDAYIDALVNEAAGQGAVSVPAMLVTSDGRVDTAVLLASLVARSTSNDIGEGDLSDPSADLAPGGLALDHDDVYTVQPGDSLGAIALRYYGDAGMFPAIYNANKKTLITPDRIQTGQRLTIPARNGL